MRVIDLSVPETLIREALPCATDEEVKFLVDRCAGRPFPRDNDDLLQPFTDRDTPRERVRRIKLLLACSTRGSRTAWASVSCAIQSSGSSRQPSRGRSLRTRPGLPAAAPSARIPRCLRMPRPSQPTSSASSAPG